MRTKQPSLTARGAAEHRAAHQTLERGIIFKDPFACSILGEEPQVIADRHAAEPHKRSLRLYIASRSRFAEDALAVAVARGVRQAVVLGAGFDTFALRNPHAGAGLRVFEVDHPDTQDWKRERLQQAGMALPPWLNFVPVDFERQELGAQLFASELNPQQPTFFFWLGVVPYLTHEAVHGALRFVASLPSSEVVFDYSEPVENSPPEYRAAYEALRERVAAVGEPLISHFEPGQLAADLRAMGFGEIEDVPIAEAIALHLNLKDLPPSRGGVHLLRARRLTS